MSGGGASKFSPIGAEIRGGNGCPDAIILTLAGLGGPCCTTDIYINRSATLTSIGDADGSYMMVRGANGVTDEAHGSMPTCVYLMIGNDHIPATGLVYSGITCSGTVIDTLSPRVLPTTITSRVDIIQETMQVYSMRIVVLIGRSFPPGPAGGAVLFQQFPGDLYGLGEAIPNENANICEFGSIGVNIGSPINRAVNLYAREGTATITLP